MWEMLLIFVVVIVLFRAKRWPPTAFWRHAIRQGGSYASWEHEEFEVETDQPGEWPMPFWSETVRRVVVR